MSDKNSIKAWGILIDGKLSEQSIRFTKARCKWNWGWCPGWSKRSGHELVRIEIKVIKP